MDTLLILMRAGRITGSNSDGCTLQGACSRLESVQWTETYDWGTSTVQACLPLHRTVSVGHEQLLTMLPIRVSNYCCMMWARVVLGEALISSLGF
eukprot:5303445-Amphidinium_carterae.1